MANILDTNTLDLYFLGDSNVVRRVRENLASICVSSITAEEQLTGRISGINRARSTNNSLSIVKAHEDFVQSLDDLRVFPSLTYSEEAERVFAALPAHIKRKGTQDCRIAAQAIAHGMTVITRNTRDFQAIGAPCDDWSK